MYVEYELEPIERIDQLFDGRVLHQIADPDFSLPKRHKLGARWHFRRILSHHDMDPALLDWLPADGDSSDSDIDAVDDQYRVLVSSVVQQLITQLGEDF